MAEKPTIAEKARILELHRLALIQVIFSDWKDKDAVNSMNELFEIMQRWE